MRGNYLKEYDVKVKEMGTDVNSIVYEMKVELWSRRYSEHMCGWTGGFPKAFVDGNVFWRCPLSGGQKFFHGCMQHLVCQIHGFNS